MSSSASSPWVFGFLSDFSFALRLCVKYRLPDALSGKDAEVVCTQGAGLQPRLRGLRFVDQPFYGWVRNV